MISPYDTVSRKAAIGGKSHFSDDGQLILKRYHKVKSWSDLHLMFLFVDSICFALGNKKLPLFVRQ